MSNLENNTTELQNILAAVNALPDAEGGTSVPVEEKDVNFFDYDGTLLYSYTLEEIQSMTELPPDPTPKKDFLTFQGWNWTLEQIKAHNRAADVGAIYKTSDGKTRLVISLVEEIDKIVQLNINGGEIVIDWGDGTTSTVSDGSHVHEYAELGRYTIAVSTSGALTPRYGDVSNFVGDGTSAGRTNVEEVYFGENVETNFGTQAFLNATNLTFATVPNGVTIFGSQAFAACVSLRHFNIPSTVTSVNTSAINNAGAILVSIAPYARLDATSGLCGKRLKRLVIPDGQTSVPAQMFYQNEIVRSVFLPESITSIGNYAFDGSKSLVSIRIPANAASIGQVAFRNCTALKKLAFLCETPPAVSNANAFTNIPTTCVVEVPAASLTAYQEATNYSGIAAQMVGV